MTRGPGPVLFVLPTLAVGGTEAQVVRLATACQKSGPGAVVACLRGAGPLAETLTEAGVPWSVLDVAGILDPRGPLGLLRLIRRVRPSVVHAFLSGFDAVATVPARLARVPGVLGSRRELATWMRRRHRLVETIGTVACDRVVCCSEAVRRHSLATERVDPGRLVVLRGGVDHGRFRPDDAMRKSVRAELGVGDGERLIVTVANFDVEKGHETLLAAAAQVRGVDSNARFVWAGDGPLRPLLERLGRALVDGGGLQFLGSVGDVSRLLAAADLFVMPSLREGLPNALLEAMSTGVPVIASDVGGIPEVIDSDSTGLLVPPGAVDALGAALIGLLGDPARRAAIGADARRRILAEFGAGEAERRYLALIQDILGGEMPA